VFDEAGRIIPGTKSRRREFADGIWDRRRAHGTAKIGGVPFLMRSALYLRISTRDGRQDVGNQRATPPTIESQGWPIVAEYEDHETGGKVERRQFRAIHHLNALSDHGVGCRSLTEP